MTTPAGFAVDLAAAEPLVRQPVAIDHDDRGRLWVLQYLQYPNPAGLKRVKVDRYSRTTYDRVPQPPPHGPRGADKLTILIDRDKDGTADQAKDFVTGLNLATGFAFGDDGVFVLQVPYLLYYADKNRDDVPDGDPQVLLKGFGMEDTSSLANSLTWGPDGWLYGTQGTNITANIRGVEFEQGVWRYHPRTKQFELFCEGGGNSWGLDFDRRGNLLYSTNHGGYLMHHGVQGAYYEKAFGKHGELHNPFAFGYFPHVPHKNFRGGHVTVGGFVYQEDAFPASFRHKYLGADLLGHAMYWNTITADGATFRSACGGALLQANDAWFAPSDMAPGPDGAVYIADWHDQRTAHPDPDAQWDRSNGRIFRLRYGPFRPWKTPDPHTLSSEKLIDWLTSPSEWKARRGRRVLAERQDRSVIELLWSRFQNAKDEPSALRLFWALHNLGGFDEHLAAKLANHRFAAVRAWTVRFLGDNKQVSSTMAHRLVELAQQDADPLVISQLACTAKRLRPSDGLPIAHALASRKGFAGDRYIPLLIWWAVERHAMADVNLVLERFASKQAWSTPLIREVILGRLMRRFAGDGSQAGLAASARLLASAPTTQEKHRLLSELDAGLKMVGRKRLPGLPPGTLFAEAAIPKTAASKAKRPKTVPPALARAVAQMWNQNATDPLTIRVAARLGEQAALDRAAALAGGASLSAAKRVAMLAIVEELGDGPAALVVLPLVFDEKQDPLVRVAAVKAVGRHADKNIHHRLLQSYTLLKDPLRGQVQDVLLSRQTSALAFLEKIDRGELTSKELTVKELRRVALHQDSALDTLMRKHWGEIRAGTPEEKLAEMRRLQNDLRAGRADLQRGKAIFNKHCANCHRLFGEGGQIGPDLTQANRQDFAYLLVSLVDPSAQIRKEFLSYVAQTRDGRVITGLLTEETPARVTLLTAKNEKVSIAREDLEDLQASPVSLMPDDLLKPLKPQELRDLFGYLQTNKGG